MALMTLWATSAWSIDAAIKEAKSSGKAMELGKVEFEKFNIIKFGMKFWGETFVAGR